MSKAQVYDVKGKKKGEIELPKLFEMRIREDIVAKYFEADKIKQPYASDPMGGKKASASGTISHKRHDWKGHYGRGISRIPRKTMWRRGTQFFWIGAEISSTRGGRRAHPPKGIGRERKINKKEMKIAMNSGFAASGNVDYLLKRYARLDKADIKLPVVVSGIENAKTKDLVVMFKEIFGKVFESGVVMQEKKVRAGIGKRRGRKYKSNAGLLLVTGSDEKVKMKGVDVKQVGNVRIADLYPLGRLTVYTEKAMEELAK